MPYIEPKQPITPASEKDFEKQVMILHGINLSLSEKKREKEKTTMVVKSLLRTYYGDLTDYEFDATDSQKSCSKLIVSWKYDSKPTRRLDPKINIMGVLDQVESGTMTATEAYNVIFTFNKSKKFIVRKKK